MLEITVGHWPFSDQFHYLTNQINWFSNFCMYIFNTTNLPKNVLSSTKMANQFLNFNSTTDIVESKIVGFLLFKTQTYSIVAVTSLSS